MSELVIYETGGMHCKFGQHCGYWWSGALAPLYKHLTHEQLETHGCVFTIVATDALVLMHQASSIHSADWIFVILDLIHTEMSKL